MFPIRTVGAPTIHGAGVTGTQGIGVNTPIAADVADATVGFASDWQVPKGRMFTIGILSIILASGVCVRTLFVGRTIRELGAIPKLHFIVAPIQTC